MKKIIFALAGLTMVLALTACNNKPSSSESSGSSTSGSSLPPSSSEEPVVEYGLPKPETGRYIKDADVLQENNGDRLLVYVTNAEAGEEDNVIAIRKGIFDQTHGYAYGDEHVIVNPSNDGWDQSIGSASLTKGNFAYDSVSYSYLLAYQGNNSLSEVANSIGLAVANDPLGTWTKIGTSPVLAYDALVYGETYMGFHAPSLINLNKNNLIRLFWTWADAYGHFSYFLDFDASNLGTLDFSGYAMVPNNGNLTSGDAVTMVPNADFAYDDVNKQMFMIKDYSPSASQAPKVSTRIELAQIAESELYTTDEGNGWASLAVYIFMDTPQGIYERLYSGSIVSDAYGHILSSTSIEIVYNISELEADNPNYLFTQQLASITYNA